MKRLLTMTAMVATLALGACGKDDKGAGGGAATPAAKQAAAASQSVFPQDTKALIGISVKQLIASKLWKEMGEKAVLSDKDAQEGLAFVKEKCGFDPMGIVDSVVIGLTSVEPPSMVIVVSGKFEQAKIHDCFKAGAEKDGKKLTIAVDGKIAEYAVEGETDKMYVAWLDGAVAFIGEETKMKDKAALQALLDQKTSIKDNKALSELLGKVDTGATAYFAGDVAGLGPAGMMLAAGTGDAPTAVWGNVNYAKDLKLGLGIRYATAEAAKKSADMATAGMDEAKKNPMMGALLGGIKASFSAEGTDTKATVEISEKDLDTLIGQAKMMMGGMMGGGMGDAQ